MEEDVDSFCNTAETNENHGVKEGSKDYINLGRRLSQSDALEQIELPYEVLGSLSQTELGNSLWRIFRIFCIPWETP